MSRCFYFENGANEHMSGATDGWCSALRLRASQETVMFAVPHLMEWTQKALCVFMGSPGTPLPPTPVFIMGQF